MGESDVTLGRAPDLPRALLESFTEGRRIGPYRLIREIGRGGMGSVFLAERVDEVFRKHVALKVVRGGGEDLLRRPEDLQTYSAAP